MKKLQIFILTALLLAACKTKNSKVIIKGTILDTNPEELFYTASFNNTYNGWFYESAHPDSSGYFIIKMTIEEPQFIGLLYKSNFKQLILEPGQSYEIEINEKIHQLDEKSSAQKFYESLPDVHPLICDFFKNDISNYINIYESIKDSLDKELKELDSVNCSEAVRNLIKYDRKVYYNLIIASLASRNNLAFIRKEEKTPDEIWKMWEEASSYSFITNPQTKKAIYSYYLLDLALWNKIYAEIQLDDLTKIRKEKREQGQSHSHIIQLAIDLLPPENIEFFFASFIQSTAKQNKYEKELISLFDNFKIDFPNSEYIRFLTPEIERIVEFYSVIRSDNNQEIKFLEDYQNIDSLSECLASFYGKKVYVDIWSTSCGPCKEEFEYNKKLKEILKNKGVDILYISFDDDLYENRWKDMIKYYNLSGYHIRANEEFKDNLIKRIGMVSIPRYLIIDEQGIIINNDAPRPSNLPELEKQL